jgi:hypothetical protein
MADADKSIDYKPSAFYFRKDLHAAKTPSELRAIGMVLTGELERLQAWV